MRAAIYARLSREDRARAGTDVESTATQVANARTAAKREGWSIVEHCVFTDEDVSGAEILRRAGLQDLLAAAEAGSIDVVVLRALDRLARDALRQSMLLGRLADAGVQVYDYTERSLVPLSGLAYGMTAMRGVVAELERAQTGKRVREKVVRIVELGGHPGRVPFGYRLSHEDGIPFAEIVPERAEIVREIGRRFVACGGVARQVARSLDGSGILSPSGGKWRPSTVVDMMRHPLYRGVLRWGQRTLSYERGTAREVAAPPDRVLTAPRPHLRIWPAELQEAIDAILAKPRKSYSGATVPRYMLSGYATCGVCGKAISVRGRPSGIRHYLCGVELRSGRATCRGVGARRVERVDQALVDALMPLLDGEIADRAIEIVRARLEAERSGGAHERDRDRLAAALRKVEIRQRHLTDAIAEGDPPAPLMDALRKETERAEELKQSLARLERARKPAQIDVERGVRKARQRLRELSLRLGRGGAAARPVLDAVLGGERLTAIPVRQGGERVWHMSAQVHGGWLLACVTDGRHGGGWRASVTDETWPLLIVA